MSWLAHSVLGVLIAYISISTACRPLVCSPSQKEEDYDGIVLGKGNTDIAGIDDQILMQLGGYGNYEGEHKQEFNNGLRQILADARDKKIKDFDTLAKSIIDYRAGFRKDPYKILPLGDIKL